MKALQIQVSHCHISGRITASLGGITELGKTTGWELCKGTSHKWHSQKNIKNWAHLHLCLLGLTEGKVIITVT